MEYISLIHHFFCSDLVYVYKNMGENFQDYFWIQDFEADFSQKVSLKILN